MVVKILRVYLSIIIFALIYMILGKAGEAGGVQDDQAFEFYKVAFCLKYNEPFTVGSKKYKVLDDLPKVDSPFSRGEKLSLNPCYRSGQGPMLLTKTGVDYFLQTQVKLTLDDLIEDSGKKFITLRYTFGCSSKFHTEEMDIYSYEDFSHRRTVNFLLEKIDDF